MSFVNLHELEPFTSVPFPYSRELKDLPKSQEPKLWIENSNQSLYLYLKNIRNGHLTKKLHSPKLLFDYFIEELIGKQSKLAVQAYYPPQNLQKLDDFITELKTCQGITPFLLNVILLYIMKDFSFSKADRFHDVRVKSTGYYNFIQMIYYIDRFDFIKAVKYLNLSKLPLQLSTKFQAHFFKLLNIIPFQPDLEINSGLAFYSLDQLEIFVNMKSSRASALTVYTVLKNNSHSLFQLDFQKSEIDLLLIYLDSITDILPLEALLLYQRQLKGSSLGDNSKIEANLIIEIIIKKIVIKSLRQRDILNDLLKANIINKSQVNKICRDRLALQTIINWGKDSYLDLILLNIAKASKSKSQEIHEIYKKFPKFFNEFKTFDFEIKDLCLKILHVRKLL